MNSPLFSNYLTTLTSICHSYTTRQKSFSFSIRREEEKAKETERKRRLREKKIERDNKEDI